MDIEAGVLVTLYVIMLGPLKLIGPFAVATAKADPPLTRQIALRAFALSTTVSLMIAVLGGLLMSRLHLSIGALATTMGLFLGHWAVQNALAAPGQRPAPPERPTSALAIFPITTPAIIPPQGVALLVLSSDIGFEAYGVSGVISLAGLIVVVMTLNLLTMLVVQPLMRFPGVVFWETLGRVAAVVLAAVALQIVVRGLSSLGALP